MKTTIIRVLVLLAAIGVSSHTLGYLNFEIKGLLALKGKLLESSWYLPIFYTHVFLGTIALVSGGFQFFPKLRKGKGKWHRNLGITYTVTALMSSSTGLIISCFATGGWITISGFFTFSLFWLVSTLYGYRLIKSGQVAEHRNWMSRSYAAAFAAVTLRVWLLVFPYFGLAFIPAYQIASWMSWVINLLVVELVIKIKRDRTENQRVVV